MTQEVQYENDISIGIYIFLRDINFKDEYLTCHATQTQNKNNMYRHFACCSIQFNVFIFTKIEYLLN